MMPVSEVSGTIRAGESLSEAIDCKSGTLMRIYAPSDWSKALLSFQVSEDNVTWADVFNSDGFEVTATVVPSAAVIIRSTDAAIVGAFIKLRSGSRAKPIEQENDCTFTLVLGS